MAATTSARAALRAATAPCHDRVDRLFSTADLADRAGYSRFLLAQAAAFIAAEDALDRAGAGAVLADWPARRRAALLRADLAALDLAEPDAIGDVTLAGDAAILGGVYVLEGSRLGGQVLRRSVPADLPTRFLGARAPAAWRGFLAVLDERVTDDVDVRIAVEAAVAIFLLFERSGERFLTARPA